MVETWTKVHGPKFEPGSKAEYNQAWGVILRWEEKMRATINPAYRKMFEERNNFRPIPVGITWPNYTIYKMITDPNYFRIVKETYDYAYWQFQ